MVHIIPPTKPQNSDYCHRSKLWSPLTFMHLLQISSKELQKYERLSYFSLTRKDYKASRILTSLQIPFLYIYFLLEKKKRHSEDSLEA